jgi:hypothetical protein
MTRTVAEADREQLARKISSSPTLTTTTVRVGKQDSETQVVDKKFFAFMVHRRFIIVFSRAHPLDLLQRKL